MVIVVYIVFYIVVYSIFYILKMIENVLNVMPCTFITGKSILL